MNILGEEQAELSERFAWKAEGERFAAGRWETAATGAPILADAAAWLDCTIFSRPAAGSHSLYIGEVQASGVPTARGGAADLLEPRLPRPATRLTPLRWIATSACGLEEITAAELAALALPPAGLETGGVAFEGGWEAGLRANWRLRTANRVLLEVASWPSPDDEALYRGAHRLVAATELPPPLGEATGQGR